MSNVEWIGSPGPGAVPDTGVESVTIGPTDWNMRRFDQSIPGNSTKTVFISYSHLDSDFVNWLTDALDDAGVCLWVDYLNMEIGDSIVERISQGLTLADYLVIVLSAASLRSPWVKEEMNAAFVRMMEGTGIRILPIRIQECEIPPLLKTRKYADFTKDREKALAELIGVIMPETELWEVGQGLQREFLDLLSQVRNRINVKRVSSRVFWSRPRPKSLREIVFELNRVLTEAVHVRYQIERRTQPSERFRRLQSDHLHSLHWYEPRKLLPIPFEMEFEYLTSCGLEVQSETWAGLRMFANLFLHGGSPRGTEFEIATATMRHLSELQRVIDTLCTKQQILRTDQKEKKRTTRST